MGNEAQVEDHYVWVDEEVRLHIRDFAGPADRPPILCIPGLTRNARDFDPVVQRYAGKWRVICVNLRGRGESGYSRNAATYQPMTYLLDVEAVLKELGIERFVAFGTSLGGLVTLMLAAARPGRVAGALLNDIGPEIEAAGLDRIRSYVGKSQSWPTWLHAARELAEGQASVYPDYDLLQWITLAKRLYRLTKAGRIVPDYDAKIAEPIRAQAAAPVEAPDLWPAYLALGDVPVAITRGELSDILSADVARDMAKRLPCAKLTTVPRVGHAPALDEPASFRAMDALLKSVAAG
jgi:pimeloyl-ACP methyl ester carboxylesterase